MKGGNIEKICITQEPQCPNDQCMVLQSDAFQNASQIKGFHEIQYKRVIGVISDLTQYPACNNSHVPGFGVGPKNI